jgi:hypothetical protein
MTSLRNRIAALFGDYFATLRRDDYIIDGVDPKELADMVLREIAPTDQALPEIADYDTWIRQGMAHGWCGPSVCFTHDGVPSTLDEDLEYVEGEPCLHIIRLYEDADTKAAVEANHSPSVWRATNMG